MAFIDEITINLSAGKGGDGVVRWLHEKGKEFSGPAGGDGGNGGDVYAVAVSDIARLASYRHHRAFSAENGGSGGSKGKHGRDGEDFELALPVGSYIKNLDTGKEAELVRLGEKVRLLAGGRGGFGNRHFKGSRNIRPMQSTAGKPGGSADFYIELRLIADAGLVGLPNAGKSSLLNALTRASAKVGSYEFTTLEPNLGSCGGHILADIPGLIEGASRGKGLGFKFLRHIRRTKLILHCISLERDDLEGSYQTIRHELETYDPALAEKPEIIVLTKSDLVPPAVLTERVARARALNRRVVPVSLERPRSLLDLGKTISAALAPLSGS